jgi:Flp pilus assembly pilin Flp
MKVKKHIHKSKRGAALVEYGLIVAGVALVAAAAVSIFGSKAAGLVGASARILPGANSADNKVIDVGHVVAVKDDGNGNLTVDGSNDALGQDVAKKLGIDDSQTPLVTDPNAPH